MSRDFALWKEQVPDMKQIWSSVFLSELSCEENMSAKAFICARGRWEETGPGTEKWYLNRDVKVYFTFYLPFIKAKSQYQPCNHHKISIYRYAHSTIGFNAMFMHSHNMNPLTNSSVVDCFASRETTVWISFKGYVGSCIPFLPQIVHLLNGHKKLCTVSMHNAIQENKLKLLFSFSFVLLVSRFMNGTLTDEEKAHSRKLQLKISELERKIKDFEISLPSQAG